MDKNGRLQAFMQLMSEKIDPIAATTIADELKEIGFFDAPASTKYHGNYPGGLFDHSFAVTKSLLSLTKRMELKWERPQSPYLVGMLHDLCKCDQYIRREDDTYEYNTGLTLTGHGDKSVIMAQKFISLTEEEILCIRWGPGRSWRHQLVAFMTRPDPVIWGINGLQKEGTRLDQMVLCGVMTSCK